MSPCPQGVDSGFSAERPLEYSAVPYDDDNETYVVCSTFRIILFRMSKVSHDSETPAYGQQVITACAFIHRTIEGTEKVFLPKRADTKKFLPGKYELPGGHIDYGEDITAGLRREIEEELSVVVNLGDPFAVFTYTNEVKGSHSIEVVYFAQVAGNPDDITTNPEDHSTSGWFSEGEAVQLNGNDNDEEVAVIRKAFALLRGESPLF